MNGPSEPYKLTPRDAKLIALFAEDRLTDDQCSELRTRLHQTPELLRVIAQLTEIEEHILAILKEEHAADKAEWLKLLSELDKGSDQAVTVDLPESPVKKYAEPDPGSPEPDRRPTVIVIPKLVFYGSIAAVILVSVGILWPIIQHNLSNPEPPAASGPTAESGPTYLEVATLVAEADALWEGAAHEMGLSRPVYNEEIRLVSGKARLRFANEAEIILQGPCVFKPISTHEMLLLEGTLVGRCETDMSKGFVVHTPQAKVVDLGTEFGVAILAGQTDVTIFKGRVAASRIDSAGTILESMEFRRDEQATISDRITRGDNNNAQMDRQFASLLQNWTLDRIQTTGAFKLIGHIPEVLDYATEIAPQHLQIFPERHHLTLDTDLTVDYVRPGRYSTGRATRQETIPQGTRVTSYIIHISRLQSQRAPGQSQVLSGTVTFDGIIVGIIASTDLLNITDDIFGLPGVQHAQHEFRGMIQEAGFNDRIGISPDARTFSLDCKYAGIDQLRILVAE